MPAIINQPTTQTLTRNIWPFCSQIFYLHYSALIPFCLQLRTQCGYAHTTADLWRQTNIKHTHWHTHTHTCSHITAPTADRHTHTQKSPPLSITSTWLFFSLLLFHIPLPDTNPGLKIPFKSTVCRLCFTGRLCYCVITHKQSLPPSLFPSLFRLLSRSCHPSATLPPSLLCSGSRATD